MAWIHSDNLGTIHIGNSLSVIQLQRAGKIPINSIHGLYLHLNWKSKLNVKLRLGYQVQEIGISC